MKMKCIKCKVELENKTCPKCEAVYIIDDKGDCYGVAIK
jgi:hypothetical protein